MPEKAFLTHPSNEWSECYFTKTTKIVSPSVDRLSLCLQRNNPVKFYQLFLNSVEGNFNFSMKKNKHCEIVIHTTIFDATYKQFFGLTCISPGKSAHLKSTSLHCDYGESIFLATSIRDNHILLICEIVATQKDGKDKSLGWTAFRPFSTDDKVTTKLDILKGTPRALMFLDDPFEKNKYLTPLSGASLKFSFTEKPKLTAFKQFIPENVLLSSTDIIGAVRSNGYHPLEKPFALPQIPVIIDDLYVYLNPNVVKFESEFCKLIAEDKSMWDKLEIEPSMITISERRLKVGVHNGWKYVHEPYVVQLSLNDGSSETNLQVNTHKKRLNLKASLRQKAAEPDEFNTPTTNHLIMRNSIVLNEVSEDPLCTIIFEMEYIINVPIHVNILNTINKKNIAETKRQYETHHILVRWGAFSPFANKQQSDENYLNENYRYEMNLHGSSDNDTMNPDFKLLYKMPDSDMHDDASSAAAPGKISFNIKKGNQINFRPHHEIESDQYSRTGYDQIDTYSQANKENRPIYHNQRQHNSNLIDANKSKFARSTNSLYNQMMPQDEHFQTPQANLLMNQMMNSQQTDMSRTQPLVGVFGGSLELYPIYNPSLHMPVLALQSGQIGGRTMSRAAYAKLQSSKFPAILDRYGKPAEVIDGNSYVKFNLQNEEADMLTCNQICIQFLAFSRTIESMKSGKSDGKPQRVFITFQFYRFPEFKTPSLNLEEVIEDYSVSPECTPFVLKTSEKSDKSGYMICYNVDPTNLKYGEKKLFLQYLAHHAMFIDVWDADSLHLIGTATLQLKELLRQGKEAVQSTYELNIMNAEYDDDDQRVNSGQVYREGTPYASDSHIKNKGMLHVRIGNVGLPFEDSDDLSKLEAMSTPSLPITRVIASKSAMNAFGQTKVSGKIDEATTEGLITHSFSKAHHMAETFKDIHAALVNEKNKNITDESDTDPQRRRKLNRMEIVRKLGSNANVPPMLLGNHRRVIEERNKDLKIMEFYRNQTKHDQILSKLREFTTTEYAIYPNFGITEFFEFVITNPYNQPQVITILIDDPDIQVVTNGREWRHLKLLNQIYSQVEDNMFHREEIDQNKKNVKYPQIYLRPKETINIPFKFQSFKADNTVEGPLNGEVNHNNDLTISKVTQKYELRKAHIWFRAEDQNPIAILRLHIEQQPHVVNQTFRFNECEHSFLKKTIRLPSSARALASESTALLSADIKLDGTSTEPGVSQLYVRTSDPNCVCESRAVTIGEPHDIFIKIATGASPNVKKFYVAIYADEYLAIPLQIWQIFVHSLHRVDVTCTQGQTSRFSLILKGTQSSRLVKCFPSNPEEMSVIPQDQFMLAANAVQELNVGVQPTSAGVKHYYLNVVDSEMKHLVHSWFIYINCKPPIISKSFELTLPVSTSSGQMQMPSQKRVSYTNPYSTEKVFIISTNRDDLLTFKDRRIKFGANEQRTLALKFIPNSLAGFCEIYVFINNENDTNEETFALRVHYVNQHAINNH